MLNFKAVAAISSASNTASLFRPSAVVLSTAVVPASAQRQRQCSAEVLTLAVSVLVSVLQKRLPTLKPCSVDDLAALKFFLEMAQ